MKSAFLHGYGPANFFGGIEAGNFSMTGAGQNVGVGYQALQSLTYGAQNVGVGNQALQSNTYGYNNTAIGYLALQSNITGNNNTAIGSEALPANSKGANNTAIGGEALAVNVSGYNNIAVGVNAGNEILLNNNIDIGNSGTLGDSGIIRIGDPTSTVQTTTYIDSIYTTKLAIGVPVEVTTTGQLGILSSSRRYKDDIQSMAGASDVLLALRPVTYHYKPAIDPKGVPQFGLVAEEVDKVDPDLVVHDAQHGIYTVRYEAVNAMLLNEFQKEHRTVEKQNSEIKTLEQSVAELKQLVQSLAAKR